MVPALALVSIRYGLFEVLVIKRPSPPGVPEVLMVAHMDFVLKCPTQLRGGGEF